MATRIYRLVFVLFMVAMSMRVFAQTDVGFAVNGSELSESTLVDEGETITVDFDEEFGFDLTLNHFWTARFSTELGVHGFGGDMSVGSSEFGVFDAGQVTVAAISGMAQFHFNRDGRFSPHVGAGIAFVGGEFEPIDDEDGETIELETETTWTAGVGANVKLTERWLVSLDVRYIEWSAVPEGESEEVELDPLLVSAGIKLRF